MKKNPKTPKPLSTSTLAKVNGGDGTTRGLATPGCINWLAASARDANLFS